MEELVLSWMMSFFTIPWTLNFFLDLVDYCFMPFWLSFPFLPYLDIVEFIANKWEVFLKHDLIPFEDLRRSVRVCLTKA